MENGLVNLMSYLMISKLYIPTVDACCDTIGRKRNSRSERILPKTRSSKFIKLKEHIIDQIITCSVLLFVKSKRFVIK